VDFGVVLINVILLAAIAGLVFRKQLRAWLSSRFRRAVKTAGPPVVAVPDVIEPAALTARLHGLDNVFNVYGNEAAHPSALHAHADFMTAVALLSSPSVKLPVILQYVEGNRWGLSCAALVALRGRPDREEALPRVLIHCEHYSPWQMHFALELLFESEPRTPVGAPVLRAKNWWIGNRFMPNIFREYFDRCAARGDAPTFGPDLETRNASLQQIIRRFLEHIQHPTSAALIKELDEQQTATLELPAEALGVLNAVGRFWRKEVDPSLVAPDGWKKAFELAAATLRQNPPRALLVCGEPLVGKTSFLELLATRLGTDGWTVFEASGVDLQADQIYIGQLEGRIRSVIDELSKGHKLIWYIPDIVQLALSGRHQGQTATMLDQIAPAIAGGRLVVWCEATPKGAARLLRVKPLLRGLFETIVIDPLSPGETLSLARAVTANLNKNSSIHFHPDCAQVALDTANQYLGSGGLPGSALYLLRLTAVRAETSRENEIAPRRVLETLAQLSGLPAGLHSRHQATARSRLGAQFLNRARSRPG
jgi:ATP-dependent Clp protease ATP-binding subunit ClpC